MKNLLIILFALFANINGDGHFKQMLNTTDEVKVILGLVLPGKPVETAVPVTFILQPGYEKTFSMHVNEHVDYTELTISLYDVVTDAKLGPTIHRRLQTIRKDDHQVDEYRMNNTVLTVRSRYECSPYYFGSTCLKFCKSVRRHRCDQITGDVRCDIGWMGMYCDTRMDPKSCGCENSGTCVAQVLNNSLLECECQEGTSGEKCENLITTEKNETNNSHICSDTHICLNGGKCVRNGSKPYCECRDGFIGQFCQAFTEGTINAPEVVKNSHILLILVIFLIVLAIGAGFAYTVLVKPSIPDITEPSFHELQLVRHEEPTPKNCETDIENPPPYSACATEKEDLSSANSPETDC